MGAPIQLLGNARAFARDYARDRMPPGYLWDVLDYVPAIIDSQLTGRGKWDWGSVPSGIGDITAGIVAPFKDGEQVLVVAGTRVMQLDIASLNQANSTLTDRGPARVPSHNPFVLGEDIINCDNTHTSPPQLWRATGPPLDANAAHKPAPFGTTWKGSMVTGGAPGEERVVRFSIATKDLTAADSFDPNAFIYTNGRVTGLQGMRTVCLVFHPSSVDRIRGGPLPNTAANEPGQIILDKLFDRVGCSNPKSIAVWNDQCIFADEHGVHMTDGATIRNLTSQGGISYYWRQLYEGFESLVGCTFLDYYILTIRHPSQPNPEAELEALLKGNVSKNIELRAASRPPWAPLPPELPPITPPIPSPPTNAFTTTLICDLNRKQWFRFSNLDAVSMFGGGGVQGMERIWAGIAGSGRLARVGPMFYPNSDLIQVDANGRDVLPSLETPWYRLAPEGRKRVRFAYLSYDCRGDETTPNPIQVGYLTSPTIGRAYVHSGSLPYTPAGYTRYRLPVYKFPYGIAFLVKTVTPMSVLRVYDLGVEAQAAERSRV